jgi:hypothetical protein
MATRGPGGVPLIVYVAIGTLVLFYFHNSLGFLGLAYLVNTSPLPVAIFLAFLGIVGLSR